MSFQPKRLVIGLLLLAFIGGVGLYVGSFILFAYSPVQAGSQQTAFIEIHKGQGPMEITRNLVGNGIRVDTQSFILLGRITRQWKKIKAGEYKVSASMTPMEVFATITSGISIAHPITVREGENMYDIGADLESKGLMTKAKFLGLCRDSAFIQGLGFMRGQPPTLEGYLFPDTYFFNRTQTPEDIVKQMVKHFFSIWSKEYEERAKKIGMTRHEVVTLASIIEKETGAPQERPIISSVFHNRLKKKMKLQSDPTTIYGMWERFDGNIRKSDLLAFNPYNTYAIAALPIGPISNPGKESIHAALFPAETEYYFFVSHNDGTHKFSKSVEEHNEAVKKFQVDRKARQGKSWRDLSRSKLGDANKK